MNSKLGNLAVLVMSAVSMIPTLYNHTGPP